jgi:PAS domain-containing protein
LNDRLTYEELELKTKQLKKQIFNQKQEGQKLEKEREHIDSILSTLNTGLAIINPDLTVEWVNAQIEKLLPWAEFAGKTCYEAVENAFVPPTRFRLGKPLHCR